MKEESLKNGRQTDKDVHDCEFNYLNELYLMQGTTLQENKLSRGNRVEDCDGHKTDLNRKERMGLWPDGELLEWIFKATFYGISI